MKLFLEICFRNLYYFFTNPAQRQFYRLVLQYGDTKRYSPKTIHVNGWKIKVPDPLSFIWQFREIMIDNSYQFHTSNPAPVIIDCGSNVGLSGLYFSRLYPRAKITCIEADKEIAHILRQNIEINRAGNVNVINKAVWVHNEGVRFASEGSDGGSVGNEGTLVDSLRLKDLLSQYDQIDFLKMDIEGAENTVIPDCAEELKKISQLFIEYHSGPKEKQPLAKLLTILSQQGFHYYIKTENKRTKPFINRQTDRMYDLQLNIFAYRIA